MAAMKGGRVANRWGSLAAGALTVLAARASPPPPAPLPPAATISTDLALAHELVHRLRTETPGFRTIVTTDVEIDDVASFHRLLLYAGDLADHLIGIVTTSSEFHWAGDPAATPPIRPRAWDDWPDLPPGERRADILRELIAGGGPFFGAAGGYTGAYQNLRRHDARFPAPEHLLGLLAVGNITRVGEMATDTAGSELIKAALLDDDDRPLWLQVWGGTNTIAAALRSIRDEFGRSTRWSAVRRRVLHKAWLYVIGDQDVTYKHYIRTVWPGLRTVLNRDQFWALGYRFGRIGARRPAPQEAYLAPAVLRRIARGPLMSSYPVGPVFLEPRRGTFVGEADSPALLHLVPNGLRSAQHPTHGGWGGRFVAAGTHGVWTDCPGYADDPRYASILTLRGRRSGRDSSRTTDSDSLYPQRRWIPAMQYDLVARAAWQAGDARANHPPVAYLPPELREITARPGQQLRLHAQVADPDGDAVAVRWWHYREAGSYPGPVAVRDATTTEPSLVVPSGARPGETVHLVLEVGDTGDPPLTRYQRAVVTVG